MMSSGPGPPSTACISRTYRSDAGELNEEPERQTTPTPSPPLGLKTVNDFHGPAMAFVRKSVTRSVEFHSVATGLFGTIKRHICPALKLFWRDAIAKCLNRNADAERDAIGDAG